MTEALIEQWQQRADRALDRWLPTAETLPQRLHQAMRYAVFNGGKRVRPVLTYAAGQALGVAPEHLDAPATAVELIHAYSLVHDDLPAMDDDDLRRGQPTVHRAFDEATAILCGDALQSLAFYVLARHLDPQIPAAQRLQMLDDLALASGSRGMAGGQAIDLGAVGRELNIAELENMHIHKTGALIRASVKLGALCRPGIDPDTLHQLDHYAKCIGLAFQIQDDILDVEGDTETLGKARGADLARNKPTYPALLGLEGARDLAAELLDDALGSLAAWDDQAEALRWIARYIVQRTH
ncbi:(2E,6E)-farnesyl diphosphate synthase [Thiohalophilus thiocyanatoxydans]|uniref:Farnesyl-diphosphate synthase n=1 Tax=Thiohalophilus thiocyanatoxydans TaxID=381308 RepID=A0A4R8IWE5_9GAMM|nr:farnesyl diphosphate synthase [Thiohalophilus thiocyanatoxydans]TDY01703.1 farnesyl-diphosphate synthase [Thiohalophilus thiocyanatoxydans]